MELIEIYKGLKEEITKVEPQVKKLEDQVEKYLEKVQEYTRLMEESKGELAAVSDKLFALKSAVDSMDLIDGLNVVEVEATEETKLKEEENDKTVEPYRKVKQIDWTNKTPNRRIIVVKNGEVIGKFSSQRRTAKFLGWNQTGVSVFMRQEKETQLRKKGLVIQWE